eukprot:m.110293 g.110293  ORF g.110293 m.110293 type:complete len:95 (+) comp13395_c1_seq2:886-1170(+)
MVPLEQTFQHVVRILVPYAGDQRVAQETNSFHDQGGGGGIMVMIGAPVAAVEPCELNSKTLIGFFCAFAITLAISPRFMSKMVIALSLPPANTR